MPYANFVPELLALAPSLKVVHTMREPYLWSEMRLQEKQGRDIICRNLSLAYSLGSCLDSLGSAGPPLMFSLVFYIRYYATAVFACDGYRAQHPAGLLLLDPAACLTFSASQPHMWKGCGTSSPSPPPSLSPPPPPPPHAHQYFKPLFTSTRLALYPFEYRYSRITPLQ